MTIQPVPTNNIPDIFAPTTQELYTTNKKAVSFVFPFRNTPIAFNTIPLTPTPPAPSKCQMYFPPRQIRKRSSFPKLVAYPPREIFVRSRRDRVYVLVSKRW